jgi:hypothetical protein
MNSEKIYNIIDKEFVDCFVKLVNEECTQIRKPKYSIEYYLYYIILVLTDLKAWRSLKLLQTDKPKNHYKTIQDKHLEWSQKNLYEKAYKEINKKYHQSNYKRSANLTLFIDSTNIYNKNGNEKIGYGHNPKKQESRISVICDSKLNIHSLTLITTKQKTPIKKTIPYDNQTIDESLINLNPTDLKYKTLNLVGDKGYAIKVAKKLELKQKYNVNMVYPHRKNQRIKTPIKHKLLLKKRYVIENVNAKLKVYDRICLRKDRKECTYMGFAYLAAMLIFKK